MNALTICQPYAHFVALKEKPVENRTWPTSFRGELAIHAGKSRDWLSGEEDTSVMAFGAIVCVVRVVACLPTASPERWGRWAYLLGHEHTNGPWCFALEDVRRLETPIPCRGAQGFWRVPDDVEQQIQDQLRKQAA